jgi:uncharacterized lipoprotein YmbA
MKWFSWFAIFLVGCSSVEIPVEQYYRLRPPEIAAPDPMRAGTLRVHDLQLGTALDSDRLLRQSGVTLEARPLARWVAPLDRLVTDAIVLGMSRARVCNLVKGSADSGSETWSLHGRIVDFVEDVGSEGGQGPSARVTLQLWLERDGQVIFEHEFSHCEPILERTADAAVVALSLGLDHVVAGVIARMRALELFANAHAEQQPPTLAPQPR